MISEFYQLRRSAIKDISSYLGFLVGFIGSAPFAWGLLAVQLDQGRFARGLWYFFGIVTTAGIFAGIAGLGIGVAAGLLWEQVHRHRRSLKPLPAGTDTSMSPVADIPPSEIYEVTGTPHLQLIAPALPPLPTLAGRRISAVRFAANLVEIDFGGHRIATGGGMVVVAGGVRYLYPDAGSRDALCGVIGARAEGVRGLPGDRIEVALDSGASLILPRAAVTAAGEIPRKINES
jgi:hypothetical protein